jgi:hypothetical protein
MGMLVAFWIEKQNCPKIENGKEKQYRNENFIYKGEKIIGLWTVKWTYTTVSIWNLQTDVISTKIIQT